MTEERTTINGSTVNVKSLTGENDEDLVKGSDP